jgi:hypothetical protein
MDKDFSDLEKILESQAPDEQKRPIQSLAALKKKWVMDGLGCSCARGIQKGVWGGWVCLLLLLCVRRSSTSRIVEQQLMHGFQIQPLENFCGLFVLPDVQVVTVTSWESGWGVSKARPNGKTKMIYHLISNNDRNEGSTKNRRRQEDNEQQSTGGGVPI